VARITDPSYSQGIEVERGALVDINWACKDLKKKAAVFVFIILFKSKNSFLDGKKCFFFFFFLPRLLALWSFFFSVRDALFRVAIFRRLEWGFLLFFFLIFFPARDFPLRSGELTGYGQYEIEPIRLESL
jgi:hypothetical protein